MTGRECLHLFDAQLASRHLDSAARWLHDQGAGFYSIASSGHEGNAAVAAALRPTDPITLAIACAVLAVAASIAAFLPAWRAARVDPLIALRYE